MFITISYQSKLVSKLYWELQKISSDVKEIKNVWQVKCIIWVLTFHAPPGKPKKVKTKLYLLLWYIKINIKDIKIIIRSYINISYLFQVQYGQLPALACIPIQVKKANYFLNLRLDAVMHQIIRILYCWSDLQVPRRFSIVETALLCIALGLYLMLMVG